MKNVCNGYVRSDDYFTHSRCLTAVVAIYANPTNANTYICAVVNLFAYLHPGISYDCILDTVDARDDIGN